MGLPALKPVADDPNDRAIVTTLQHLGASLTTTCADLRDKHEPADVARLERCRGALGYVDRAAACLRGETMRERLPGDHMRPFREAPTHRTGGDPENRFSPLNTGDPRLPPGDNHP